MISKSVRNLDDGLRTGTGPDGTGVGCGGRDGGWRGMRAVLQQSRDPIYVLYYILYIYIIYINMCINIFNLFI